MNIEINGVQITLTDEQLEKIANQIKKTNWKDKLEIGNFHWKLGNDDREGFVKPMTILTTVKKNHPEMLFTTQKQAELLAKKCNLMIEMHNFAYAMNEGWIPNWDINDFKWGISYCFGELGLEGLQISNNLIFGITVKSQEIAERMLEEFGERIKEVYNRQY